MREELVPEPIISSKIPFSLKNLKCLDIITDNCDIDSFHKGSTLPALSSYAYSAGGLVDSKSWSLLSFLDLIARPSSRLKTFMIILDHALEQDEVVLLLK